MRKLVTTLFLCSIIVVFAGCGSKHYTITEKDGSTVATAGEPKFLRNSSSYKFENLDGKKVILKREDIQEIRGTPDKLFLL